MTTRMKKRGLGIEKYFTEEGKNPEDYFEWEKSNIDITDDNGKVLFVQECEFPKQWSQLARKIVGSKYFYGGADKHKRENSAKQLINRVSNTFSNWAVKQKYFSQQEAKIFGNEIAYLTINQMMSFNSPVWFNVGINRVHEKKKREKKEAYMINDKGNVVKVPYGKDKQIPQTSACFIQGLEDTMESIMDLAKKEALLFKYGSGTGTNISSLRASRERLSGGGKPSGPLAYLLFWDKVAAIVKSGGITRRAAKMNEMDMVHPDIMEFILVKMREEKKLQILMDNGISWEEAAETVGYQSTNLSVRASDDFMKSVEEDKEWQTIPVHSMEMKDEMPKYPAKDLLRKIAEGTYFCGDPGMQFDTTINEWHTCPNSGRIRGSNPCSEYMFLDDSACNLASLNLMRFLREDESFDLDEFNRTIKITAIAQDLEIDNSSYPTKKIAENSHKFRPLGMGYANLGSMLMSLGLPYDSNKSRAIAGAITALLTGKVYEASTEMAEKIGTFEEYEKNREPMLKVIEKHKKSLEKIDRTKIPKRLENIIDEAEKTWNNVLKRGKKYGFRNAQATVLAPTGTIGFMMDCDTKGIEPEIGLVQTKLLSEGTRLRLVNTTVEKALRKLGYEKIQIKEIKEYIAGNVDVENVPHLKKKDLEKILNSKDKRKDLEKLNYSEENIDDIVFYLDGHETMEGAPYIEDKHLSVFDCANKPKHGTRTIHYHGHLKMMAAVQPFLSGAISKTVNLPEEITVEEIENVYIDAWKLGLKAVALYRDKSKRAQPLSFSNSGKKDFKPVRRKLPTTAKSIRHKFNITGHEGYIHVGLYEDGKPGETFVTMSKEGSTIGGLMDTIATLTSMALQYGVPLETLVNKFRHQRFEPRGLVREGHKNIHEADSVIDYVFNFLGKEFLDDYTNDETANVEEEPLEKKENLSNNNSSVEKGGFCAVCGTQMHKKGHCIEQCPKCNYVNPKGCGE